MLTNQYQIVIDFDETDDPSKIFYCQAEILEAFIKIDEYLLNIYGIKVKPRVSIENIEKGSLKTSLRQLLENLPDNVLESGFDQKAIVGSLLLKGKYWLLKLTEDKDTVNDDDIEVIKKKLHQVAINEDKDNVLSKSFPDDRKLVDGLVSLSKAIDYVRESKNPITYNYNDNSTQNVIVVNNNFHLDEDESKSILIKRSTTKPLKKAILKVKKPDLLDNSQWQFRLVTKESNSKGEHKLREKSIKCKINDLKWLSKFHRGEVIIKPQQAILTDLEVTSNYDINNLLISESFVISKVHKVIAAADQLKIFES